MISNSAVLDLGAGWGEFSKNILASKKYAMDLNPDCGKRVANYSTFLHQDCSVTWPIDDGALDIVFTSNFLEHLPKQDNYKHFFCMLFALVESKQMMYRQKIV